MFKLHVDLWNKLKNKISPPHPSSNKNIKNKKAFTNLDLYHTTYCISLFTYLKSLYSCFTDYVLSHCMFISFQDHSSIYNYLLFFLNSQDPKHFAQHFLTKPYPRSIAPFLHIDQTDIYCTHTMYLKARLDKINICNKPLFSRQTATWFNTYFTQ